MRSKWSLGRVAQVLPSSCSVVQKVKVKTATGMYTRPSAKNLLYRVRRAIAKFLKERGNITNDSQELYFSGFNDTSGTRYQ